MARAHQNNLFEQGSHSGKYGISSINFLSAGAVAAIVIAVIGAAMGSTVWAYKLYKKRQAKRSSNRLSEAIRRGLMEESGPGGPGLRKSWSQNSKSSSGSNRDVSPLCGGMVRSGSKGYSPSGDIQVSRHLTSPDKENATSPQDGSGKESQPLGQIHFSVNYDNQKQVLLVTVLKCIDLPAKDNQTGTSDPYVKLQLLPEKRHRVKTRVLRNTLSPVYEETFTFFGITVNQVKATSLHFVVLSFDRFSRDDIIGEVLCPLSDLELNMKQDINLIKEIQPRQFKIKHQSRGELLVSLCHQPAANRLTVVVLKARNLPKMDVTGLAGDPYVKLYLLYNGQRIAKKKTHVKKRTLNPVYNESFAFEVPAHEDLKNMSVEFLVLDWDRVTKNEVIGRLELGLDRGEAAEKHWQEVINNPRKQTAEWHKLSE